MKNKFYCEDCGYIDKEEVIVTGQEDLCPYCKGEIIHSEDIENKKFRIKVIYENTFDIEAINKDEAETKACKLFFEAPENAELYKLEVENED